MQFKTINDVWSAINNGLIVYWSNTSYEIIVDNNHLRVTRISNWFGSSLEEVDLAELFIK